MKKAIENLKNIIHKKKNSSNVHIWHPIHATNNRQLKNNGEELMIDLNLEKGFKYIQRFKKS